MKPITVLIVDDDYLVIQDLKTLVCWKELGFQIVATASNGKKALLLYQKYHPQVVMTDISMPVMNGLDLIEEIKKIDSQVQTLIISSYADFSYAKRAMENGVSEYLLKDEITKESLTHKLNRLALAMNHSQQTAQHSLRILLNDYFLSDNTTDLFLQDRISRDTIDSQILPLLKEKYYFLVYTFRIPFEKINEHYEKMEKRGKKLYLELMKFRFEQNITPLIFYFYNYVIVGIKMDMAKELQINMLKNTGMNLLNYVKRCTDEPIVCFYFPEKISLKNYRRLLQKLFGLFMFYAACPNKDFINIQTIYNEESITVSQQFNYALISENINNPDFLYEKLESYVIPLFQNKDFISISLLYFNLCLHMENLIHHKLDFCSPKYLQNTAEFMEFFRSTYELCMIESSKDSTKNYSTAIIKAIEFMKKNYSNSNLTSVHIAEHVMLSSGRLSVLFKQEVGQTINDYLISLRIAQAIHLLEHTNYKIYEITEKVGYKSAQYFSQVFNQRTGKRPLDFRRFNPPTK